MPSMAAVRQAPLTGFCFSFFFSSFETGWLSIHSLRGRDVTAHCLSLPRAAYRCVCHNTSYIFFSNTGLPKRYGILTAAFGHA